MTDKITDEEYRQPINLTVDEVRQLISDEREKIESDKQAYLSMLNTFDENYKKYLTALESATNGRIDTQQLVEQFQKSIPKIIKVNLERHKSLTKSGNININQFITDEQKRVNDFEYDLELVEASDINVELRNTLRTKIKANANSGKLHMYILDSATTEGSHYSIVTQFGNAIQATVLDPTGLVTPADSVFDKFIYEKGIDLKRVVSRTQFKTNGDCELMSVYMSSHLVRLAMFNLEEDIFGQALSKPIPTRSTSPECSQITLRHPMLYLFSEQFSDYSEKEVKSVPMISGEVQRVHGKEATAQKRIGFINNILIEALQSTGSVTNPPVTNPPLFISPSETIQQRAVGFLQETAQFIEQNSNLYEKSGTETKQRFEDRIKTYTQDPNRIKFGYANKLYLQYTRQQACAEQDSSEDLLVSNLGNLITNIPDSIKETEEPLKQKNIAKNETRSDD